MSKINDIATSLVNTARATRFYGAIFAAAEAECVRSEESFTRAVDSLAAAIVAGHSELIDSNARYRAYRRHEQIPAHIEPEPWSYYMDVERRELIGAINDSVHIALYQHAKKAHPCPQCAQYESHLCGVCGGIGFLYTGEQA